MLACRPVVDQDGVSKVDAGIGILRVYHRGLLGLFTTSQATCPHARPSIGGLKPILVQQSECPFANSVLVL